jgi:signal transduction histidine kinase
MLRSFVVFLPVFFLALSEFLTPARAQFPDFTVFDISSGLPSNVLVDIGEDSRGRIWIGTKEGYAVYDGFSFETFQKSAQGELFQVSGLSVSTREPNTVWIALSGNGIIKHRYPDAALHFPGETDTTRLNAAVVQEVGHDSVLVANEKGIYLFTAGAFRLLNGDSKLRHGQYLIPLDNNRVYVKSYFRIAVYNWRDNTITEAPPEMKMRGDLSNVTPVDSGAIVTTTMNSTVRKWHPDRGVTTLFASPEARIFHVIQVGSAFWVATTYGVTQYVPDSTGTYVPGWSATFSELGFFSQFFKGVFDRDGNLWLVTAQNGLIRSRIPDQALFKAGEIYPNHRSNTWTNRFVVPSKGALAVIGRNEQGVWELNHPVNPVNADPSTNFMMSQIASNGRIFALRNTLDAWYSDFDPVRGFHTYKPLAELLPKDDPFRVWSFRILFGNYLWANSHTGGTTIYRIDNRLTPVKQFSPVTDAISAPIFFATGADSIIWSVDLSGKSILKFIQRGDSVRFVKKYTVDFPVANASIRSIASEGVDALWLGVGNYGLVRWDTNGRKQTYLNIRDVPLQHVETISRKDENTLFFGTTRTFGVISSGVERTTYDIRVFPRIMSGPVELIDFVDDHVIIANRTEVRAIPEAALNRITTAPEVYIKHLFVDGKPVAVNDTVRVGPYENSLDIQYSAITTTHQQDVQFYYKTGRSDTWVPLQSKRNLTLADLVQGMHRITLAGRLPGSYETTNIVSLVVFKDAPLWKKSWFITLIVLTFLVAAGLLERLYYKQQLQVEKVRTRVAADLHDEIGSGLSRINLLSSRIAAEHPETAGPVAVRISELARQVAGTVADVVWSIDPAHDIATSTWEKLDELVRDILQDHGIRFSFTKSPDVAQLRLNPDVRRALILIVKEALNNCLKYAGATEVHVTVERTRQGFALTITDNGKGFTPGNSSGNGLKNMRNRAEVAKGLFILTSSEEKGTSIRCEFPA